MVWAAALRGWPPAAVRLELAGHDQLQHVIAGTAWDDGAVWMVLAHGADRVVGGPEAPLPRRDRKRHRLPRSIS